jgi:hypothetical protein
VLVAPDPSTIWTFAPVILIVGCPSIPAALNDRYGRSEIGVA